MKGSIIWNLQRYTSIYIMGYLIYLLINIYSSNLNFFSWSEFFLSFQTRILSSIAFILVITHAFIGLWTVGTDYLTYRTLGFLSKSLSKYADIYRKIYYFLFVLLGAMYLAVVLYIIWL